MFQQLVTLSQLTASSSDAGVDSDWDFVSEENFADTEADNSDS